MITDIVELLIVGAAIRCVSLGSTPWRVKDAAYDVCFDYGFMCGWRGWRA